MARSNNPNSNTSVPLLPTAAQFLNANLSPGDPAPPTPTTGLSLSAYAFPMPTYDQAVDNTQVHSRAGANKKRAQKTAWEGLFKTSDWDQSVSGVHIRVPTSGVLGTVPVCALGSGKITGYINQGYNHNGLKKSPAAGLGNYGPILHLDTPIKSDGKSYHYVFYGFCSKWKDIKDQKVNAGEQIGETGSQGLFIGLLNNPLSTYNTGSSASLVAANSDIIYNVLSSVDKNTGLLNVMNSSNTGSSTGDTVSGGSTSNPLDNPGSIATAAAFSSYFQMPGMMETREAIALTGRRSLMNDQPLLPWIEQIAGASLRSFMSMPNGNFYAFYPDYFGGLGRTAYWVINDVEIISGKIDLSDDALATHVFVVGDTTPAEGGFGNVDFIDRINSAGVVNVYNAFMADFLNGPAEGTASMIDSTRPSLASKDAAINFLKKYGARPHVEEVAAIRSPIYETFLAYQRFCLLWAAQFKTTFEFTFMPELYPGGLIELEGHGIQCYVDQVIHSGSYESGFTTTATLSAPAATKDSKTGKPVDPDRSWVHSGMIRAFQFDPNTPPSHPAQSYDASNPRPAPKP
jgi:hypothetical protein